MQVPKGFEMFVSYGGRGINNLGYPAIAIRKANGGRLQLNDEAMIALGIMPKDGVVIYFNPRSGDLALRKPVEGEPYGAVQKFTGKPPAVNLAAFVKRYGLDLGRVSKPVRLGYDDKSGLHMAKLPAGSWDQPPVSLPGPPVSAWGEERQRGVRR